MSWFSLIVALAKIVASLSQWALRQKHINEGQAAFIADVLTERADAIRKGNAARLDQRLRDADGVHDDTDEFRRD